MTDHHQFPISTGFVEVDGSRLHYEISGEGHPFVFFQGRDFIDMRIWDRQFLAFTQHYQVIRSIRDTIKCSYARKKYSGSAKRRYFSGKISS